MEQPIPSAGGHLPWLLRGRGRIAAAVIAAVIAYLATMSLPDEELKLLIPYNAAGVVYMALFCVLMVWASPEEAADIARRYEPSGLLMLLGVMAFSVASIVGVAAMLNQPPGRPAWLVNLHMTMSLLAVILSWFLVHIYFGLYYTRLYYDDTIVDGKTTYKQGLEFPEREIADFGDFMYYSFTIAMCYQTSDVTISSAVMRRVTLLHAIFSFIYVIAIIGLTVNIISNII